LKILSSSYPNARRDETVQDTYGNDVVVRTKVQRFHSFHQLLKLLPILKYFQIKDPYRWLENPDSIETKKFVEEEMAITKSYLEKSPFRAEINARYKELFNYPKFAGPFQKGKKFYSFQNTGLQNHL
jgi:Prolyl oligopeptidase, N-terminal beta-propeller domain